MATKEMALVRKLMRKYKTNDPFELCRALGYTVLNVPLTGVRGFYQCFCRQGIIYLADNLTGTQEQFVCAHELGHSLMHRNINALYMDTCTYLKTSHYEQEADLFAVCLLRPKIDLEEYEGWTTKQIAYYWNMPEEPVKQRLQLRECRDTNFIL